VTKDDILAAIVRAARVVPGRTVLEIGPGTGNLTRHLLSTGARVVAVEKDDALFARLQEQFQGVRWGRDVGMTDVSVSMPSICRLLISVQCPQLAHGAVKKPRTPQADNLELVHGDVLTLNMPALLESLTPPGTTPHPDGPDR